MLEKQKLVPNWSFTDAAGEKHALWDFRQKSHLVLIIDPDVSAERLEHWRAAIAVDRTQWDWLRVQVFVVKQPPEGVVPGVYAIDRYGLFLTYFALDRWNFDDIEREFVYYEARHC